MGLAYCDWTKQPRSFEQLIVDEFNRSDAKNLNFFINRVKPYQSAGRNENEKEAIEKDKLILNILYNYNIKYSTINGDEEAINKIVNTLNLISA
jgi:hypothetical protein